MVGVLDTDSGFVQVLVKRLDAAGLRHRVIAAPPSHDALVALRLPGPLPGVCRARQRRPPAARVRADPAARSARGPGDPARGDLRARVGLRDGARGYIHTHFGIGYRFAADPAGNPAAEAPPVVLVEA